MPPPPADGGKGYGSAAAGEAAPLRDDGSRASRTGAGGSAPVVGGATPLLGAAEPLSTRMKLAFAVGSLPNALSVTCTGFFLNPFLLEVAGVSTATVSALMLVGRAWDAVTTAGVGALVSRWPKLRMWLAVWIVPTCLAYFFLWMVLDASPASKAAWAFCFYLGYQLFSSAYQVPYTALTVRLHSDPQERDKATTCRMLCEILSVVVGAGGQSVILAAYNANDDCKSCDYPDQTTNAAQAYIVSAIVMTVIFGAGGVACFLGVREAASEGAGEGGEREKPSGRDGVRAAFKSKSFLCLTFAYFFIWLTVQAVQGNIMLFCKYAVKSYADKFQYLLGMLVLTATIGMPMWLSIMRRIGKRRAYIAGGVMFAPLLHLMYWLDDDAPLWQGVAICTVSGFALASTYLLPWAMLPNVVDQVELETGQRHEAVFYAFFVFFMKMGAGIALAASALVLNAAGWVDDPCCERLVAAVPCDCDDRDATCMCDIQPDSVGDSLRIVIGIVGPLLILVGVFLAYLYPLNPEQEEEVAQGLLARRQAQLSAEGGTGSQELRSDLDEGNDLKTASLRLSSPFSVANAVRGFESSATLSRRTVPSRLSDKRPSQRGRAATLTLPSASLIAGDRRSQQEMKQELKTG